MKPFVFSLLMYCGYAIASDQLLSFIGKSTANIDGASVEQSWMLHPPYPAKSEYSATLLSRSDGGMVVTVNSRRDAANKSSSWVVRNVQQLGNRSDGEYLAGCTGTDGLDYRYLALVVYPKKGAIEEKRQVIHKLWKFDSKSMQFLPATATGVWCPQSGPSGE